MKLLVIITFLCTTFLCYGQTRYDISLVVDDIKRNTIIVVPDGAIPKGGYPVVFMFHGTGGDGEKFLNISQWKEKGQKEKFITVFPSSLEYCVIEDGKKENTTKWHIAELDTIACPNQTLADDVKFIRFLFDSLVHRLSIDRTRVYATGFSNGGAFVSKLSVEMSDVFAAVGPCGGALNKGDSAYSARKVPVWFVLGTQDNKWLNAFEKFGLKEFPFNDSTIYWLNGALGRYRGVLELENTYTKSEIQNTLTYTYNTSTDIKTEDKRELRFTLVNGMGHQYPNGENYPVAIADFYWDNFFKNYTMQIVSSVENEPDFSGGISIYPNPAHNAISIAEEGDWEFVLYSVLGEKIFTYSAYGNTSLDISSLPKGIYTSILIKNSQRQLNQLIIQ